MHRMRGLGVEADVELVFPAELESRLAHRVVADLSAGEPLREVRGVSGDLIGDDAGLHVVTVRKTEVLLRRHVAKHRGAAPADHRGADRARDVVVARGAVRDERSKGVERGAVAGFDLFLDVFHHALHRDVAGAFNDHLHALRAGFLREFAERPEFGDLRLVTRVVDGARAETVSKAHRDVILREDVADLVKVRVEEVFRVMRDAPAGHDRAAAGNDAGEAVHRQRNMAEAETRVDREVVNALLRLLDQRIAVNLPGEL